MRIKNFIPFSILLPLVFFARVSAARPEYAASHGFVSCTMCHASPFGGGIRTENGKLYGSHGMAPGIWSKNSLFQIDSRALAVQSQNATNSAKGFFQMATTAQIHAPINAPLNKEDAGQTQLSFIASQNFGPLLPGLQEAFALYQMDSSTLAVGRMLIPFGLHNDEHRTFVRSMSGTTEFNYEEGLAYSLDYKNNLHLDVMLSSGVANEVSQPMSNNDSPYGVSINLRHNPFAAPLFFGLSYRQDGTQTVKSPLEAKSVYLVAATDRFSNNLWNGSITIEVVSTTGWNNSKLNTGIYGINYFIPSSDTAWSGALRESHALGSDIQLNWNYSERLILTYKQEQFTPDTQYTSDTFQRYGIGAKYFMTGNTDLTTRVERSFSTRPGVTENSGVMAVGTSIFVLFHLWI